MRISIRPVSSSAVLLMLLACTGFAAAQSDDGSRVDRLTVQIDDALSRLAVNICPAEDARYLRSGVGTASRHLVNARSADGEALRRRGNRIVLATPGCVDLTIELHDVRGSRIDRHGRSVIVPAELWLWRSDPRPDRQEVVAKLGPAQKLSVPWRQLADGRYVVLDGPGEWPGMSVFGEFATWPIQIGRKRLNIAALNSKLPLDEAVIVPWLREAAEAVAGLHGHLPVESLQVVVVPLHETRGGPVAAGRVLREGGDAAQFLIHHKAALPDLRYDWTAYHEFSHLLLPFIDRKDAWISEGLASYMQVRLLVSEGQISEDRGWRLLLRHLQGARPALGRQALGSMSTRARASTNHAVYWGGALALLAADLAHREEGGVGLIETLGRFARCCMPSRRAWDGAEIMAHFDSLAGTSVYGAAYQHHATEVGLPLIEAALARVGVTLKGGEASLDPHKAVQRGWLLPGPGGRQTRREPR